MASRSAAEALRPAPSTMATALRVAAGEPAGHPYAEWLRTYADEDFAAAKNSACSVAPTSAYNQKQGRTAAARTA